KAGRHAALCTKLSLTWAATKRPRTPMPLTTAPMVAQDSLRSEARLAQQRQSCAPSNGNDIPRNDGIGGLRLSTRARFTVTLPLKLAKSLGCLTKGPISAESPFPTIA